jgi:hypothetical protein
MVSLFKKKKVAPPYEPTKQRPQWPGAWQFTLRSTPRHHDGILAQIESMGGAHVYFSEPLAYLRGQGVSIFRVEARDLNFLDNLYRWWAETERAEAADFQVALYVNNTDFVAELKGSSPSAIRDLIEQQAPHVPDNLDDATQQLTTKARV